MSNHRLLRRALAGSYSGIKSAWDGVEDLQTYLDREVVWKGAPIAAADINLEAAQHAAAVAQKVLVTKEEAQRRILARYPQWKQVNAALGLYDATTVAAMTTFINAIRAASDAIEARLSSDPDLDPANAPEWP